MYTDTDSHGETHTHRQTHSQAHVQSFYIRHLLSAVDTFVSLCAKQVHAAVYGAYVWVVCVCVCISVLLYTPRLMLRLTLTTSTSATSQFWIPVWHLSGCCLLLLWLLLLLVVAVIIWLLFFLHSALYPCPLCSRQTTSNLSGFHHHDHHHRQQHHHPPHHHHHHQHKLQLQSWGFKWQALSHVYHLITRSNCIELGTYFCPFAALVTSPFSAARDEQHILNVNVLRNIFH